MIEAAFVCVLDASAALKFVFEKPQAGPAHSLFSLLTAEGQAEFFVPDLFYAECTNVLATMARLKGYRPQQARADSAHLQALEFRVVPTFTLATEALAIALAHHISSYDACYVALAARVQAPLITADEKLVRAMAGTGYSVQSLAAFHSPR
jgi:predicted nucleic acid-binding protein